MLLVGWGIVAAQDGEAAEVVATVETEPVPESGDAADDIAIWVHPSDPSQSVVIGTDKRGGLAVYDLDGRQLQYIFEEGRLNNVDLRYNFPLGGEPTTIVAASNRRGDTIEIFRLDEATRDCCTSPRGILRRTSTCMACACTSARPVASITLVNGEDGEIQQWGCLTTARGRSMCPWCGNSSRIPAGRMRRG